MQALIARAEAGRLADNCPSVKLVSRVVTSSPEATEAIGALPQGDCQTALYRLLAQGYGTMANYHRARGAAGLVAADRAPLIERGVGSLLRSAIRVQVAKKAAAEKGDE